MKTEGHRERGGNKNSILCVPGVLLFSVFYGNDFVLDGWKWMSKEYRGRFTVTM